MVGLGGENKGNDRDGLVFWLVSLPGQKLMPFTDVGPQEGSGGAGSQGWGETRLFTLGQC